MATITYRTDEETKQRLTAFAENQNMSINKAIDVLVIEAIREQDAYYEFQKKAASGSPEKALEILHSKAFD
jgi:antitoxin component of RelBE/YafQ-DinJ toxin-antitoxin module